MDTQKILADFASQLLSGTIQVVDLSAPLGPDTPLLKLPPDFAVDTPKIEIHTISEYDKNGPFWAWNWLKIGEHSGTHFDAPHHWITGKEFADGYTDTIDVKNYVAPVNVIDCSAESEADNDFLLTADGVKAWEAKHGPIPNGAILLLNTGSGKLWPDRKAYMGTDQRGPEAVALLHFPGLHPEAARWLVSERRINAVGLDTPSIDYGQSTLFETHRILFEKNVPAFENVANLDQLPATGASVIALPMKIRGGSGGPLRIVAVIPR